MVNRNSMLGKILVIGILILFIGAVIAPTIASDKSTSATLDDNGSLSGYVNDTSGNPIEGALVRVFFHEAYREDYSDSMGYYHVTNIQMCWCLKNCTASKTGYETEWVLLSIVENTTHDFILTSGNNPPDAPTITGPKYGDPQQQLTYTFDSVDDEGDDVKYFIDWDDGTNSSWLGPYISGEEVNFSHAWDLEGEYQIKAKAKDINESEGDWSNPFLVRIGEYETYEIDIDGPTRGRPGITYYYNFSIDDYDDNDLSIEIDWDDGTQQGEPYEPGQNITVGHSWEEKGTYVIKARAKDIFNYYGEWAEYTVTISRNRALNFNLLEWLFERFPLLEVFLRAMNLLR